MMVLAAFGFKRFSFFIKGLMTLYVATFLIGGALIGVHYFIQFDSELTTKVLISSVKGFGDPISWLFVMIGFPIAWHFARRNIENFEMTKILYDQIVEVKLTIESVSLSFKGLVDSGNQLYDPLSKLPVMIVSVKSQLEHLSDPIKKMALESESLLMGNEDLPPEWQSRLRIVPCKVVGQENQLMVAVKPDSILIEQNGDQFLTGKGLVSFTMQQLSSDDAFQCIVHPKMLIGPQQQGETEKVS